MTGFNPLCISICGKDEPFFKSLSVTFSLHNIIYHICKGNQATCKWQHMLKGQWLRPQPTPSTRTTGKVTAGEIETVFARKSHDNGSSKCLLHFRVITLSFTIYIHTSHSTSDTSLGLFFTLRVEHKHLVGSWSQ
jgi:hypothetical protein